MSCNCNNVNSNCEPCAICTPPGVTNLPDCNPVDPCDKKLNISCITYNGASFPCLGVATGDDLISVLLAILEYYFPPSYCCKLEGELLYVPVSSSTTTTSTTLLPTSTTTSTSTSSSTTSTTTILQTCNCYKITNTLTKPVEYTYVNCESRITIPSFVDASSVKYQCGILNSIILQPGINPLDVLVQNISLCGPLSCPPPMSTTTTTTTTTIAPPPLNCDTPSQIIINNYSNGIIESSTSPAWFVITGLADFPMTNGDTVTGIHTGGSGSNWGFNITNLTALPLCLKIYIDSGPPDDYIQIPIGTTNDPFYFTDLGEVPSDACVIVDLVSGPCPT